ncbi:hypothetical protein GCM10015535_01590 [Streptomyces gelaticus]|uniref:Uncharacterized protein n=1 Tax=Streptomyces gelaticus TaxID=285446 RepID=A0ABQ2VQA8_9ACTN|nr:DUF5682 family protein [Streptomyces gelaticus]GGV73837.1 hypothetical protein GCM10015535_01590 [Streptomyces gelaticus]
MPAVFLGVRHHSPACARLVERTIDELRPAQVLIEGPAEMNGRLDELLLGHELPVAVFSHYRDGERAATSWAPLCDYSPEWVALRAGRAAGAEVRFIDLPAWHPAFAERSNRYADAEARYAEATERLCRHFAVDSSDALWDRLFEVEPDEGLAERLDAYFALVRGDAEADAGDRARETYMAAWVRAAVESAGDRPVLVVTGGFHRPALRALTESGGRSGAGGWERGEDGWPRVPSPPDGALAGSFLVPYSFRQLDAFAGYQSGMPSPEYYQQVWETGPEAAADGLLRAVVERLRARRFPVSTADLIAARSLAQGLTALRGHPRPARIDVLDGLAGALITDDLDRPLPWTGRGTMTAGAHPAVVEMVAACGGDRTGRLHPATPAPPLVHDVAAQLAGLALDGGPEATYRLDLTDAAGLERSRTLHRLRVLAIPGHVRTAGPAHGADPVFTERWEAQSVAGREAALVEAGAYGATLAEAAAVALAERTRTGSAQADHLAKALFDAVLCGMDGLSDQLLGELTARVHDLPTPGPLGEVLATALGLWRHDRVFGMAHGPLLGTVIEGATERLLWLLEGARGSSGVDFPRLRAVVAARDAVLHAPELLSVTRETAAGIARRIAGDPEAPIDLRGAAFGLHRSIVRVPGAAGDPAESVRTVARAGTDALGDWLAGLFALARDEVTGAVVSDDGEGADSLIDVLDGLVCALPDDEFLSGLPALRQAFAFFPPRERDRIAGRLLERRGVRGSSRSLLRTTADPLLIARARALEESASRLLARYELEATP